MIKNILYIIFFLSISIAAIQFFRIDLQWISFLETKQEVVIETKEVILEDQYNYSERIQRGDSYLDQGFAELAQDEYLKALKQDNKNLPAYIKLAYTQEVLKNFKGALYNLRQAEKLENTLAIQIAIVKNLIHISDFTAAEKILRLYEKPSSEMQYLLDILQLLKVEYWNQETQTVLEGEFLKYKRIQEAFDSFAVYQGGQKIFLQTLIVKALIDNADYEVALSLVDMILTQRSDYRDAWIMQGYAYLQLEDFVKSKKSLEKAYDLDTAKPETQYFLGIALEEMQQKNKALEFYHLAYKNGYEPKVHVIQKIANLSLEFGYYKEAYKLYEEKLVLSNTDIDSYVRPISIALINLSDTAKAENLAEWSRKVFPNEAQSYNLSAWVEIEKGDLLRAQSFLNQSFSFNKNFAPAYYNQGRIYEIQGNNEKALENYEKAYKNNKVGDNISEIAAQSYNRLLSQ
jgi:tetratricopeptide (TPR) repeat protein